MTVYNSSIYIYKQNSLTFLTTSALLIILRSTIFLKISNLSMTYYLFSVLFLRFFQIRVIRLSAFVFLGYGNTVFPNWSVHILGWLLNDFRGVSMPLHLTVFWSIPIQKYMLSVTILLITQKLSPFLFFWCFKSIWSSKQLLYPKISPNQ